MRFEDQFKTALAALKADPQDRQAVGELCSSYWKWLVDSLCEIIRGDGDTASFIDANADLIDFGIHPEIVDAPAVRAAVVDSEMDGCSIQARTVSQWLRDLLIKVKQGDKLEKLSRDIKLQEIRLKHMENEIRDLQNDRRAKTEAMMPARPADAAKILAELENTERMQLESIRMKRQITKGAFLTVEEKRLHVRQEVELQKKLQHSESFVVMLPSKEGAAEVRKMMKAIEELFTSSVEVESVITKMNAELESLNKKTSEMTAGEIESRISEEIDYIRDLVRLSAKRLGIDQFPLVRPDDKVFSMSAIVRNLNQITEFDPHIFHNDRVPLFGRPFVLLVPGAGNSIYDWKNNCIILPMIPPGGNFMGSIATGIIEYRLDVDEDKNLLTSYNQLPDLKAVRSIVVLKARLIKEYIIWMTSEYNGYRILSKEAKIWFEHEIGPSKNDIYTPLEFQSYTLNTQEFNKLFEEVAGRLKDAEESEGAIQPEPNDLWTASILHFQQGKFDKAQASLEQLVKIQPENKMAWYNLGLISMKHMNRTLAREAFSNYCKIDTQSWWSKVARDHLRNLG